MSYSFTFDVTVTRRYGGRARELRLRSWRTNPVKGYPIPPALSAFVLLSFSGVVSAQNPWDRAKQDKFEQVIFNRSGSSHWQQFRAAFASNRPLTEQDVVYNDAVFRLKWSSAESAAKRLKRILSDEAGLRIITFDNPTKTVWIQANRDEVRSGGLKIF
jgi:hypothetical protein